ncbi:MAG TPA: peptide chain release factor N(5)-glutamine methyltransferase [Nitrospiraceae bacterium]|nr:peptide chain release factor N(5)-glutamine methyltransferase [Nitrospiraceae bacterium]
MNEVRMMTDVSIEPHIGSRTLSRLLRESVCLLADAGVEQADNEAAWIVEFALGMRRADLYVQRQCQVDSSEWASAMALIRRRAMREPLQYILGTQEFCGLDFDVVPDVLIPRPETELLVDEVVRECAAVSSPAIADLGTGSGCIAVALAKALPNAHLYATDVSKAALDLARRNAARHAVDKQLMFLHGDLFKPIEQLGLNGQLTAIVSNPPYIADSEFATLPPEVAQYEPKVALAGGPDGLFLYRRLLRDAREYLTLGGLLVLEIGYGHANALRRLAEDLNAYHLVRTLNDQAGIERVLTLKKTAL